MLISIVTAIFFCAVTWRWPLAGYGIFLAFATPLVNLLGYLVHPFTGQVCYMLATVLIFHRLIGRRQLFPLDRSELACLILTLIVFARTVVLTRYIGPTSYIYPLFYASLWAPFLIVVRRLDDREIRILRDLAVFGLFAIGIFSLLGYFTGNASVLELSMTKQLDEQVAAVQLMPYEILAARHQTLGVYNYVPYAYWLLLFAVFGGSHFTRVRTILYMFASLGAWVTMLISVTRSLLAEMLTGTFLVLWVWWLKRPKQSIPSAHRQNMFFAVILFGVLLFLVTGNFGEMMSAFQERFSSFSNQDQSFMGRVDDNLNAWDYLTSTFPLFGAPGPVPRMNYTRAGDPSLLLIVWLYYGLIGLILFLLMILPTLMRLVQIWFRRRQSAADSILIACLTGWALVHVMQILIMGCYLQQTDVLFLMWFMAEVKRQ
jgi:hypothetical protein